MLWNLKKTVNAVKRELQSKLSVVEANGNGHLFSGTIFCVKGICTSLDLYSRVSTRLDRTHVGETTLRYVGVPRAVADWDMTTSESSQIGILTQGTESNASSTDETSTDFTVSKDTSQSQLLWAPGAFVGLAMVIFLGISFYHYHRRFRRKRKLAMEYVNQALDVKRPRIGAPGCFTNLQQLSDLGIVQSIFENVQQIHNGDIRIKDKPVSVKLRGGCTQNTCIYPNPTFQTETVDEDGSKLTVISADIHRTFQDEETTKEVPNPPSDVSEVEVRLSQLCQHCVNKVLSSTNQTRKPVKCYVDSDIGEYRLGGYEPVDDYAMMDAFHGRPQPRERRRPSAEAPRNKFGFKGKNNEIRLCPLCFSTRSVLNKQPGILM